MVAGTSCSIPTSVLRNSPFNMPWGSSIFAKVLANNIYGSSAFSNQGNGAVILTIPDAPRNFANNAALTSAT